MKKSVYSGALTPLGENFNSLMKKYMKEVSVLTVKLEIGIIEYHIKLSRERTANEVLVHAFRKQKKIPGYLKLTSIIDDNEKVKAEYTDEETVFLKLALAADYTVLEKLFQTHDVTLEDVETFEEISVKNQVAYIQKIAELLYLESKLLEDPFNEDLHLTFMKREYIFRVTKVINQYEKIHSVLLSVWEGDNCLRPNILFSFDRKANNEFPYKIDIDQDVDVFIDLLPHLTYEVIEELFSRCWIHLSPEGKLIEPPKVTSTRPKKELLTLQQYTDGLFDLYNKYKIKVEEHGSPLYEKRMNRILRVLKYVTTKSTIK